MQAPELRIPFGAARKWSAGIPPTSSANGMDRLTASALEFDADPVVDGGSNARMN